MENEPKIEMTPEQYEAFLDIKLTDVSEEDLKKPMNFVFSISPNFTIFISKTSHEFLMSKYGVNLDDTLTEGYMRTGRGEPEVIFKTDIYQPKSTFNGSKKDLDSLKEGAKRKILSLFISN